MDTSLSQLKKSSMSKSHAELIKEIAMLELEVMNLEKHLLYKYRKVFDQRLAETSGSESNEINLLQDSCRMSVSSDSFRVPRDYPIAVGSDDLGGCHELQKELGSSIHHRCHSSLSLQSSFTIQSPPSVGKFADVVYSYHSVPLTFLERASREVSDSVTSEGENLSNHGSNQVTETANSVSEEMVRCISSIYRELGTDSKNRHEFASPVVSFTASTGGGSPRAESNLWSPPYKIYSLVDSSSDTRFTKYKYESFGIPYPQMVEVLQITRESTKQRQIEPLFRKYRSLVSKLETQNPSKLKHEEKLAFWINVHNALVMHAFLVYSTPNIKLKRGSFLLKVAYKVGGHTISVGMIQNYILGRLLPHPRQWIRSLFHARKKFRTADEKLKFSLDPHEPLSYFALSCGCHSDPPVRVYTPKTVFHDLISARGEYILSNYKVDKEHNMIMLPKILETYGKQSGLHPADFMSIIDQILPTYSLKNRTCKYRDHKRKGLKGIGWITPNYSFRYYFPAEMFQ